MDEQVATYNENVLVNLIDMKGSQKTIGDAFTKLVKKLDMKDIHYEWFDFHHECRKMKWENISILVDKIKSKMEAQDYFIAQLDHGLDERDKLNSDSIMVQCKQNGVIRTNCMDCLDRTNVVQSVFARNLAHKLLKYTWTITYIY